MGSVMGLRWGRHDRYDRVVVDLQGDAAYRLDSTRSNGGPDGAVRVEVVLAPATLKGTGAAVPAVRDAAACTGAKFLASDGDHVRLAVDLRRDSGVRVTRLSQPDRVVLDFAHPPLVVQSRGLRRGDRMPAVATWQWWLTRVLRRPVAVDADFGPATDAATRKFQHRFGLTVDGIAGKVTVAAAEQALGLVESERLRASDVQAAADMVYDAAMEPGDDALLLALHGVFVALGVVTISLERHPYDAVELRRRQVPFILDEQLELLAAGMRAGTLVTVASFVAMWQARGLAPRDPEAIPLDPASLAEVTRAPLRDVEIDRGDLLLALVAALSDARGRRAQGAQPAAGAFGDRCLDGLQVHLLSLAFTALASPA